MAKIYESELRFATSDKLTFSDSGTPKLLFKLPEGAVIVGLTRNVQVAFNGTSPTLALGASGSTAEYQAASAITAIGGTFAPVGAPVSASGEIWGKIAASAAPSAGELTVGAIYALPTKRQADY
ncbi:MAG: hypothetical protein LBF86_03735 [Helicobacteraceae bacterium]|jgi:hypothetical protein|nr:hypothetical protein [Helicobacteraceae bacterium]